MTMTSDARAKLATTIRDIRRYLLGDASNSADGGALHDAVETAYRPAVRARDAGLSEAARIKRRRLEQWAQEQVRADVAAANGGSRRQARTEADFVREAEKQAGYTLLNRIVILRLFEAAGFRKPAVVTSGWKSQAYSDFRDVAPELVQGDETEGYGLLLKLVFEDMAVDLPGLYGPAGVADLVPITAPVLRYVIEALDSPLLTSCWGDDMTLGWVYQYWNDPEREAIKARVDAGGKVERHEIASKTQFFTERYMVEWLLHNSLGPMWLAMCRKHGWTPEVEATGTLAELEKRRVEWRALRDAGTVRLTELMSLYSDEERRWAYFVPQPIPDDAVVAAPESVRDLKILDPAVGSGHFLVVAFDLLVALYGEEARHRGETGEERWSDRAIVERILEHNLHGIDIDPRAVQIAAAALWLKARKTSPDAHPRHLNLVTSNLRLGNLSDDDPALLELRLEVEKETGLPAALTDAIVHALKGADHLGSLLKIDAAVDEAIHAHEEELGRTPPAQREMYEEAPEPTPDIASRAEVRANLLERLERFLARHTGGDDLGLRLRGEQLARGVRFVRLMREAQYDLVVGNPPYQGTSKMVDRRYVAVNYPRGKADLYAAFLERGLQFTREGGVSALLTMRNWMFINQYVELRMQLLASWDLRSLGDFDRGAFEEVLDEVVSVVASVFCRTANRSAKSVALQPTPLGDHARDSERTLRKRAAVICGVGLHEFELDSLSVVSEWPVVYWWTRDALEDYANTPKVGELFAIRAGLTTGDNPRFVRQPWEPSNRSILMSRTDVGSVNLNYAWVPYIKGAAGRQWLDDLSEVLLWENSGLEKLVVHEFRGNKGGGNGMPSRERYFKRGVAIAPGGNRFSVRAHRYVGVFSNMGTSIFPDSVAHTVCSLNTTKARAEVESLNPGFHFEAGDARRIALHRVGDTDVIFARLESSFDSCESRREPSVEFRAPGPSSWRYACEWAQLAVDRSCGSPLPPFEPVEDPAPCADYVSFSLGVALGRFGPNGEGIRNPRAASEGGDDLSFALPHGILFLDGSLDPADLSDGLGHEAAAPLHAAWAEYGAHVDGGPDGIRDWLRLDFFGSFHRKMYEHRPIHWPLSSEMRTFVAWINIHRWDENTLRVLQADHLNPAMTRLDGELNDLRAARDGADRKSDRAVEQQFARVQMLRDELAAFVAIVEQCAEKGPPTHAGCTPREVGSRYVPDLDDGVMINSAALWPLLEPQWKDPKKWWKELSNAQGKKDYDWSHLAMRYWPKRVDGKCRTDPSLGVAHGCFWKYHPARAWAWELRLQSEIGPNFRIEEPSYRGDGRDTAHRAEFLSEHVEEAIAIVEKEVLRRRRKLKQAQPELRILESGLWSAAPELCWAMELRVIEKQESDFLLISPDEPEARTAFQAEHPAKVWGRRARLANIGLHPDLYEDDELEDESDNESDAEPDEPEEGDDE